MLFIINGKCERRINVFLDQCMCLLVCGFKNQKWITFLWALSLNNVWLPLDVVLSDVYLCIFSLEIRWCSVEFKFDQHKQLQLLLYNVSHFFSFLATKRAKKSLKRMCFCFFYLLKLKCLNTQFNDPVTGHGIMDKITCGEMNRQWAA